MTMNFDIKKEAYDVFMKLQNKTQTAEQFGVSPRTIGRWIEEVESIILQKGEDIGNEDTEKIVGEEEPLSLYRYFVVDDGNLINITRVTVDGSEPPHSEICHKSNEHFEKAIELYTNGDLEGAFLTISNKHRIENVTQGKVTCYPEQARLVYEDGPNQFEFPSSLTSRVIDMIVNGEDATGLMKFADRLSKNPSKRAVSELFDFLQAMDIAITEEGMVRCFKKVREDYTDCHTGRYDNSVGVTVEMPRHMVNDDSNITCSHGLHVCSRAYLSYFGGARTLAVDVDPADFVSIPRDYYSIDGNNQVKAKARVCKYVVVADITDEV